MEYKRNMIELMKERHSSRTFGTKVVEETKKADLKSLMESLACEDYRFELVNHQFDEGTKLSTYGTIKGAQYYLIGIMSASLAHDQGAGVRFGYAFEQVILKATDLGLQTCWMVATFKAKNIEQALGVKQDENIVMVSPLGYEVSPRVMEKFARLVAGSDNRKPWSDLFFDKDRRHPLTKAKAGAYAEVLEMVRLGPSASNKQPWRIIKTEDRFDFYAGDTGYKEVKGQKISKTSNDMGIAKAHFELSAQQLNLKGTWVEKEGLSVDGWTYVCSWRMAYPEWLAQK